MTSTSDLPVKGGGFDVRCDEAAGGQALPHISDLIRGCPFLRNDIYMDARLFAEHMMWRLREADESGAVLLLALAEMMLEPDEGDFLTAAAAFESAAGTRVAESVSPELGAVRCHFYAAFCGYTPAASQVAAFAVSAAYRKELPPAEVRGQVRGAVAWLLVATGQLALPDEWTRRAAGDFMAQLDEAPGLRRQMVERMLVSRRELLRGRATTGEARPDPLC